ncbi:MAG: D-amino acid dehydrogenase large subunit [Candidatus Carbobacillus altaicus]|uniref:D-amino acid dehydrogenase large subunit n=1 Tax=Candidatus Carbonibacillus altaicus TaxID=2163959 RepID=A0A2R6XYW5_9BACL|nr:MAG: D-amino acid dehydrogenase large subunit [Candidatus Carbobacillus altaicus]
MMKCSKTDLSCFRRKISLFIALISVILAELLSGCSMLSSTGSKTSDSVSVGTDSKGDAGANGGRTDGETAATEETGNAQGEASGEGAGEEGTLSNDLEERYPWLAELHPVDREEIERILRNPLFYLVEPKLPEANLPEVLWAIPPGPFDGRVPDEEELQPFLARFPIMKPYDKEPLCFDCRGALDYKSKLDDYGILYSKDAIIQAAETLDRLGAGAIVAWAWQTFPRPETLYVDFVKPAMPALQDDPEYGKIPYRAQVNIEVILDASGSMKETIGGKTKLALAKEAMETLVRSLPKEANVALRAFGHRPQPTKEASCRFSELLYPFGSYSADRFAAALGEIEAAGWTPLAYSIERAGEDFRPYQGEGYTNIVVIVSDGAETCGGDPLNAAEALKGSAIQPYFHIIGFDVDAEGKKQLSALAERVGGIYRDARNLAEIQAEFDRLTRWSEGWEAWRKEAMRDLGKQRMKMIERLNEMEKEWHSASDRLDSIYDKILYALRREEEKISSSIEYYLRETELYPPSGIMDYWRMYYRPLLQRQIDQNFMTLEEEIERLTREQATKQGP